METKRFVLKYSILLLVYIILIQIVEPYGLQMYLTFSMKDGYDHLLAEQFRYISTAVNLLGNILFVIFLLIDLKGKKAIEWIIIAITLFNPLSGLLLIMAWKMYGDFRSRIHEV